MECFQELATLEWLKINNNLLRSLPYTLMEPVLGTLKYIDVYSKISNPEIKSFLLKTFAQRILWFATVRCDGTGNGISMSMTLTT